MPSSGPNSPVTVVNDTGVGSVAWTNPGDAVSSNDTDASAILAMGAISNYLKATDFGFNIASGATINGITVAWERSATIMGTISDNRVRIVKGGTIGATDKSAAGTWGTVDAYQSYGSTSDLWGESWTPADINGTTFGAAMAATSSGASSATVDHVRITVQYTDAAGGGEAMGQRGFFGI